MAEKDHIEKQALAIWQRLYWQYRAGFGIRILLAVAGTLLLTGILCRLFAWPYLYGALLFILFSGMLWWQGKQFFSPGPHGLTDYLNHRYNWLEFSTGLIPNLPEHALQQLQRQRILHRLVERRGEVKAWPDLRLALIAFASAVMLYMAVQAFNLTSTSLHPPQSVEKAALPVVPPPKAATLPHIKDMQIEAKPPAYTRQASFFARELSLEAPEGSIIAWKCQLSAPADVMQVVWNSKDTLAVKASAGAEYSWHMDLASSLFYQLRYSRDGSWYTSPVYTLIAKDDLPPMITVQSPAPYTFMLYGQQPQIQVSVKLTDDYGLAGVHMVATVSRGSGESVKFREERLNFAQPVAGKKEATLQKLLSFADLKMEPGDELYFYTEAWDRAIPPQKTRSDTYFVQWEDTTSQKLSVMAGLSVDNMPAYFRSQRQIIIDTEKLIKEQRGLSREDFKNRSDDLGVDQKVLRLRYGQFLGEEFETNTGGQAPARHSHEHNGDEEGEEHHREEGGADLEDLHNHEYNNSPVVFGDAGDMLKGYSHRHDTEEAATLFDDALKAQLKAALAQMWEAELRLRTLRPKEALPFEYKALELIKSIQQKSRVYVERVGFEPPPLKPAEKRLTGELHEVISPSRMLEAQKAKQAYPAIRRAVPVLEKIKQLTDMPLSQHDIRLLEEAGAELGNLILQQPGIPVTLLNTLHEITAGRHPGSAAVAWLQEKLLKLLPKENVKPGAGQKHTEPELDMFVKELNKG